MMKTVFAAGIFGTFAEETATVWHIFESKYTGLAQRDAGDYIGDVSFIKGCIGSSGAGNPEAKIEGNVIEMSSVNVTEWGKYTPCNVCGNRSHRHDCVNDYWCTGDKFTNDTLAGRESYGHGGYWYSFPAASEGQTWTQKLERRIEAQCLVDAWCAAAECSTCSQSCVKRLSDESLKETWDMVFSNVTLCPDQELPTPPSPSPAPVPGPIPPVPTPVPSPAPSTCKSTEAFRLRDEQSCVAAGCAWCTFQSGSMGFCRESCPGDEVVV